MRWLEQAFALGFRDQHTIREEPAFEKYRKDARFREFTDTLSRARAARAEGPRIERSSDAAH
jgi:hypothetical protein